MMQKNDDSLGLDSLGDLSTLLENDETTGNGKPLDIDMALIDEDPEQPRNVFTKSTLKELATSIEERGVKTPISVRVIENNRFMINHGARRFRASKLAGKTTIPAYIDYDYSKADQVIENLHRDNLTSREIAEFIGRQISEGKKKGEIAKEIGKSGSFVTQHHSLLNLPDELEEIYNSGKCNDVTVIYEFAVAYKKHKDEVIGWISSYTGEWNRANVKLFKEYLKEKTANQSNIDKSQDEDKQLDLFFTGQGQEDQEQVDTTGQGQEDLEQVDTTEQGQEDLEQVDTTEQGQEDLEQVDTTEQGQEDLEKLENGVVIIEYDGAKGELILDKWPSMDGYCWAEFESGIIEINMAKARFISLIEG